MDRVNNIWAHQASWSFLLSAFTADFLLVVGCQNALEKFIIWILTWKVAVSIQDETDEQNIYLKIKTQMCILCGICLFLNKTLLSLQT
jgi:hypothetical protein